MPLEIIQVLNTLSGALFVFLILAFIFLSWALNYHWNRYEISITRTHLIKKVYFIVSGILLLVLLILFLNFK
ncbi:MAG: hypothetical protein ACPL3E_00085 [Minisyncoccia bacterium]